ncbi:P-loop containing nucleoside triphosphate hydrolase protein [Hypoxylon sp. FL0890]|nr:P-loop containing nucleoside triphosphate hydrolase protein [Hypoxylon sp. FL0890]
MTDLMVLTEEEIRYFRALLEWEPSDDEDDIQEKSHPPARPAGQFMFLVLGDKGCGKTSILERFCHGTFTTEDHPPDPAKQTIEQERDYQHTMLIEDKPYILNALELPSTHLSSAEHLKQAVQITEAAVLVYDVKSRASFALISDIYNRIHELVDGTRRYGLILVGNKSDYEDGDKDEDEEREVSWVEGYRIGCTFIETSAKTGENVDEVFTQLGREVLKLRWLSRQEREEIERPSTEVQRSSLDAEPARRLARWRSWARPWFRRRERERERKFSAPY